MAEGDLPKVVLNVQAAIAQRLQTEVVWYEDCLWVNVFEWVKLVDRINQQEVSALGALAMWKDQWLEFEAVRCSELLPRINGFNPSSPDYDNLQLIDIFTSQGAESTQTEGEALLAFTHSPTSPSSARRIPSEKGISLSSAALDHLLRTSVILTSTLKVCTAISERIYVQRSEDYDRETDDAIFDVAIFEALSHQHEASGPAHTPPSLPSLVPQPPVARHTLEAPSPSSFPGIQLPPTPGLQPPVSSASAAQPMRSRKTKRPCTGKTPPPPPSPPHKILVEVPGTPFVE